MDEISKSIQSHHKAVVDNIQHSFGLHTSSNDIEKGKKMPIGTVSNGRKKVAEGKWVDVKKEGSNKPAESKDSGDELLNEFEAKVKEISDEISTIETNRKKLQSMGRPLKPNKNLDLLKKRLVGMKKIVEDRKKRIAQDAKS